MKVERVSGVVWHSARPLIAYESAAAMAVFAASAEIPDLSGDIFTVRVRRVLAPPVNVNVWTIYCDSGLLSRGPSYKMYFQGSGRCMNLPKIKALISKKEFLT